MIKTNIAREYPAHFAACNYSDKTLYIADYSNQTGSAREVEVFEATPPTDIDCFSLKNEVALQNGFIIFNKDSFTADCGSLSQCECVVFPEKSTENSWVLFAELKYTDVSDNKSPRKRNNKNIRKAIEQLCKTRSYYYDKNIFTKTNPCYLLASLPMQLEPFAQSLISQTDLLRLKRELNVILRLQNSAIIQDDKVINV
jgi:hypothetical protein